MHQSTVRGRWRHKAERDRCTNSPFSNWIPRFASASSCPPEFSMKTNNCDLSMLHFIALSPWNTHKCIAIVSMVMAIDDTARFLGQKWIPRNSRNKKKSHHIYAVIIIGRRVLQEPFGCALALRILCYSIFLVIIGVNVVKFYHRSNCEECFNNEIISVCYCIFLFL